MYSEELMNYLYAYNMPKNPEEDKTSYNKKHTNKSKNVLNALERFKSIYATVPIKINHE